MYRYLFFDADGTLFDFLQAERNAMIAMGKILNLAIGERELALYSEANLAAWRRFERGELGFEELKISRFEAFSTKSGLVLNPAEASEHYEAALAGEGILYPESVAILQTLIARGYTLYLATNGLAAVQRGRIKAAGIGQCFTDIFISEEMGTKKPDTEFFTMILRRAGISEEKEACLMIGDTLSSDIAGGIASGIDTLWINIDQSKSGALKPTYTITLLGEMLDLLPPLADSVELDL